ncbi:ATPase inhibitor mai-2, mitochondrial-like isoform X2 [Gigantopelta aegis]|uniref:ATPase inhibitor mai-2, mitochondrial-like isoform X2 n=1 Tax=Gigantopelta aegis TaxID=1735272 RepID=UPI001B88B0E5|nr:ATPase inhibitor mai-2, mitochondrial-like isoform X2 [Gigantopelta aegis]
MASRLTSTLRLIGVRYMSTGEFGSGAGKGGGTGGSIRDAGGAFGKMEAAREEEYFRKQQALQLERLHKHLEEEVSHHETVIKQHKEAIDRHKKKIGLLKHEEDKAKKGYDSD